MKELKNIFNEKIIKKYKCSTEVNFQKEKKKLKQTSKRKKKKK